MPRALARVLLAGGGALAQPPEYLLPSKKRLEDAKAVVKEADIRVLRIMWGVTIPRVTLRYTLGYEPLAPLGHSTFQVVLRVVLPRIFTKLGTDFRIVVFIRALFCDNSGLLCRCGDDVSARVFCVHFDCFLPTMYRIRHKCHKK